MKKWPPILRYIRGSQSYFFLRCDFFRFPIIGRKLHDYIHLWFPTKSSHCIWKGNNFEISFLCVVQPHRQSLPILVCDLHVGHRTGRNEQIQCSDEKKETSDLRRSHLIWANFGLDQMQCLRSDVSCKKWADSGINSPNGLVKWPQDAKNAADAIISSTCTSRYYISQIL